MSPPKPLGRTAPIVVCWAKVRCKCGHEVECLLQDCDGVNHDATCNDCTPLPESMSAEMATALGRALGRLR